MALKRNTKVDASFSVYSMPDIVLPLPILVRVDSALIKPNAHTLLLASEEDPTFSIFSDQSVPVGEIVGIMNIAKRNHYKVILATQPE